MNEMIERVARAIFDSLCGDTHNTKWQFGEGSVNVFDEDKDRFRVMARAAITAMREPTEAMQVAGALERVGVAYTTNGEGRCLTPNHVWRAMIDQILKDQ